MKYVYYIFFVFGLLTTTTYVCGQIGEVPYPVNRYILYEDLSQEFIDAATTLGYTQTTWDLPGSADIESLSYETNLIDVTDFEQAATTILGLNEDTWDCYINHYGDYSWAELVIDGLDTAAGVLGYTEEIWDDPTLEQPESNDKFFDELSTEEQDAAAEFCYFADNWNELPLQLWTATPPPTMAPTVTQGSPTMPPVETDTPTIAPTAVTTLTPTLPPATVQPSTQLTIPIPEFRFIVWSDLDTDSQDHATALGYTENNWNIPGTNAIEAAAYNSIEIATPELITTIRALGYTGRPMWDCYINHYTGYSWNELELSNVQEYFITLGWTEETWNDSDLDPPASETTTWDALSDEERTAARSICYNRLLWDSIPLTEERDAWDVAFGPTPAPVPTTTTSNPAGMEPTTTPPTTNAPATAPTSDTKPTSVSYSCNVFVATLVAILSTIMFLKG